jgi:hypothetical protein
MARHRIVPILLFAALAVAALAPIRSYDFFWHLATGRWIVEQRALPRMDPFSIASDRVPWINGEWLFEVVLYGLYKAAGIAGLAWIRAAYVAGLFVAIFRAAAGGEKREIATPLLLACIGFAGAAPLLDVRPSALAPLFVVLALTLRTTPAYALLTAVWINVHPSALLAPVIAVLTRRRIAPTLASAIALLVNPFGWRAITAPIALLRYVRSGGFVNAEWLPSTPAAFPLLYITLALAALIFATAHDRRAHVWRIVLAVMFAALAISGIRHQPLWYAAMPLLLAPVMAPALTFRIPRAVAYAGAAAAIVFAALLAPKHAGLQPERFPIEAVARLQATGLRGNVYNADQFGGYLIWTFYPERRVLTDGRNELYHALLPEYDRARLDERAWRALLRKHRIDLAVDEHRPPQQVRDATTGSELAMPASLAYWPRRDWALIAYDGVAMVFARRAAYPNAVVKRWEIRGVVPDAAR